MFGGIAPQVHRRIEWKRPIFDFCPHSYSILSYIFTFLAMYISDPYQHTLWLKYVLYTHIIAFIIKSNWKLSQNLHTWTTQYVHFQCGIYWPKPVVLASSSTSISSKWNILSEFFIFYTKASTSALETILSSIMCGSKWPVFKVCK